jgi:hypothetical protein
MSLIKLSTSRGDFFFEEDYKVVLLFKDVWKNVEMREWCVKYLQGDVITGRGETNNDVYVTWYFERKDDAMLFALRWS